MINFIFFWRLEKEKWFDKIIDFLGNFRENQLFQNTNFFLFWEWSLKKDLFSSLLGDKSFIDLSHKQEDEIREIINQNETWKVYYFSWRRLDFIKEFIKISNFNLMPSNMLETFWLTALESLRFGVPIISYSKWGLSDFVLPELVINWSFATSLLNIIENFSPSNWQILSNKCIEISSSYNPDSWLQEFRKIIWKNSWKILMVNDYLAKIWWAEIYVYTMTEFLNNNWFEVEIFWWDNWKMNIKKFKILGLLASYFNVPYYFKQKKKIQKFNPDIIWCHNVSRFLGILPILHISRQKFQKIIMFHDFWNMVASAARLENEDQIPEKWIFWEYFKKWNISKNPLKIFLTFIKFIKFSIINKILQKFDIFLVPSNFMQKHIFNLFKNSREKTKVLKHF